MAARKSSPPGHKKSVIPRATSTRVPARNRLLAFDRGHIGTADVDRRSLLECWRPKKIGTPRAILLLGRNELRLIKGPHFLPSVPTHHRIVRRIHIFAVGERIVPTVHPISVLH